MNHVTSIISERHEKRCSACKDIKPINQFHRSKHGKDGFSGRCKTCARKVTEASRKKHPPDTRAWALKYKYGLTQQDCNKMLDKQQGKCICGKALIAGRNTHVDHDHSCCPGNRSCGKCVRGLLCGQCNRAIGLLNDSPATLIKLAIYMKVFDNQPVWRNRLKFISDHLS